MVTLIDAVAGGFVATVGMTIAMMVLGDDSPPPTALFWSKYVGDGTPDDYMMVGMVLHLVYGTVAGGVFGIVVPPLEVVTVDTITTGILWGFAYGVVMFIGGAVFWMNIVLDMDPDPRDVGLFALFHLIYGAIFGVWIGMGILG